MNERDKELAQLFIIGAIIGMIIGAFFTPIGNWLTGGDLWNNVIGNILVFGLIFGVATTQAPTLFGRD
jgi:Na+/H+-dicarboxylate symporter